MSVETKANKSESGDTHVIEPAVRCLAVHCDLVHGIPGQLLFRRGLHVIPSHCCIQYAEARHERSRSSCARHSMSPQILVRSTCTRCLVHDPRDACCPPLATKCPGDPWRKLECVKHPSRQCNDVGIDRESTRWYLECVIRWQEQELE